MVLLGLIPLLEHHFGIECAGHPKAIAPRKRNLQDREIARIPRNGAVNVRNLEIGEG